MRDKDVRNAVKLMLHRRHLGDLDTRIVEEMGVWSGTVRIDIAVINGELSGFELKSNRDTLERLPMQADIYSKVFDRVALVVGDRHAEKAIKLVPDWWSVTIATEKGNGVELQSNRDGSRNPFPNPLVIAQLLWKDEVISILDVFGLAEGWRARRVKSLHERLACELPFDTLRQHVREALKKRDKWLR